MIYYFSADNNNIFLSQRNNFFKDIANVKKARKKIKQLYLYTHSDCALQFIALNYKKINTITALHVLHAASIFGDLKYHNFFFTKFSTLIFNLKLMVKIFILGVKKKKLIIKKVNSFFLIVTSQNINKNKLPFDKKEAGQTRPIIKYNLINEDIYKKKVNIKKKEFLIDSHFPLHPDSFSANSINYKISFLLIDYYLNFLKRKINLKINKLIIFLNPRTYELIEKNSVLKKYLKKYENKFIFLNGLSTFFSLIKNINRKKNKLYIQPGTQLSVLKYKLKINQKKIHILKFDEKFLLDFQLLKKENNSNYLNNYKKIEIDQYKFLDRKKFFQFS